ncbi:MAG: UDP-2,3-diacylglucosamine diphosphatase [Bacteroidales bacterium]|nr:UDP-2,3-diacylglucosamine diphosphatase [Bacteroidales bacterium]MBN2758217.1 UDP-2,3-diacylglucosamine diphosphatase [Bacteroidales bacterium]
MELSKKIYFASDLHLGLPNFEKSLKREKLFVKWLDEIKKDAAEIYLLGDIFDFWHEWKRAAPQGFVRMLGKLAEISDSGIPIHLFTGNHDIWIYDYLPREIGVILHRKEYIIENSGKKIFMAHGDGLGPGDFSYKLLKKIFTNKFLQWCFKRLHPDFALWIGHSWSSNRRMTERYPVFHGIDNEWLISYSKKKLEKEHFDYFIFGHRHLPGVHDISEKSKYINLGDWLSNFTYGVFDGEKFELKKYLEENSQ